mmetsp:Transcript_206/g.364  ORF Transcript_206/g.364 Transcript_206/m.364 type:complete len:308 (-) Transcript_206:727-1650(-)
MRRSITLFPLIRSAVVMIPDPFQQGIRCGRSTTSVLVREGLDPFALDPMQQWCENVPRNLQFVVAHKGGLPTSDHLQNQSRIGFPIFGRVKACLVTQIQFRRHGDGHQTGTLDVGFEVDCLVGLQPHDEFLFGNVIYTRKHALGSGGTVKLNANFCLAFVECLSGLEDEGYALPSWIFDPQDGGTKCGCYRVLGHGRVLRVGHFIGSGQVLSQDDIFQLHRIDATQDLDFFVSDILCRMRSSDGHGWFHGDQTEYLHEMILQYITDDTGSIKVSAPTLTSKVFLECYLYALDVISVPQGFKHGIGES